MNQIGTIEPDFEIRRDRIKRACRMMGYCLLLDDWDQAETVFLARLTEIERANMAAALLSAMHPENVIQVAESVCKSAGSPDLPFGNVMAEARIWAASSNPKDRKAVAAACIEIMGDREKSDLRKWLDRK